MMMCVFFFGALRGTALCLLICVVLCWVVSCCAMLCFITEVRENACFGCTYEDRPIRSALCMY